MYYNEVGEKDLLITQLLCYRCERVSKAITRIIRVTTTLTDETFVYLLFCFTYE